MYVSHRLYVCILNKKSLLRVFSLHCYRMYVFYQWTVNNVNHCTFITSVLFIKLKVYVCSKCIRFKTITGILVHVNISQVYGVPTHVNIWGTLPSRACLTLGHNLPVVHIRYLQLTYKLNVALHWISPACTNFQLAISVQKLILRYNNVLLTTKAFNDMYSVFASFFMRRHTLLLCVFLATASAIASLLRFS